MNKQELIKLVAADAELTQRQASLALTSALNIIMETVASGEKVQLQGFGTFEVRYREGRVYRNPQTGKLMEVPASVVPIFKSGSEFKSLVDE